MKPRLISVPSPVERPVDITLDLLRPEIAARDWSRVHVAGDRSPPLELGERVRRTWWR